MKLWGFYRNSNLEAKSVKQLLGLFFSVLLVAAPSDVQTLRRLSGAG
jgi:hypothetical protein